MTTISEPREFIRQIHGDGVTTLAGTESMVVNVSQAIILPMIEEVKFQSLHCFLSCFFMQERR